MGLYDADFAAADDLFAEAFGSTVVYTGRDGEAKLDSSAIIESETVRTIRDQNETKHIRVRRFSIRREVVDSPEIFALVRIGTNPDADGWPIVRHVGQDAIRTKVECEREETHEHGAGYRGG